MIIGKKDKRVIECFSEKRACEGHKLSTDGVRLDGHWLGGRDMASWSGGRVVLSYPGSSARQTVQRAVRRVVPKFYLAETHEVRGRKGRYK